MGAWHFLVLSAEKKDHAHKIPCLRGGGQGCFGRGEVEVPILFLWAWGFFRIKQMFRGTPIR